MAAKEDKETKEALKSLGPLAQLVGKSAGSLWTIFVRRYVGTGLAQLFGALWTVGVAVWIFGTSPGWGLLISLALAGGLTYQAIQNLFNPHYPALGDVVTRVKALNKPQTAELVQVSPQFRG